MPSSNQSIPNISLSRNDILKISKEEFVTIEEYNEFICKMKKEIKSKLLEMIKVKQIIYSQKSVIIESMINGTIEFRSAQLALSQIEHLIPQINQNISNCEHAYKIVINSEEKIPNKKHNEVNNNENLINKSNKKLTSGNAKNLTKPDLSDKESCKEIKENRENNHPNEELDNLVKGSTSKKEKENSNQTKGNNKFKSKPKLKIKKLNNKNINNKFINHLLVAVFLFQNFTFTRIQYKRGIRDNSHESDFSPPSCE